MSRTGRALATFANSSREWFHGRDVQLPRGVNGELPMAFGPFTLTGGYCSGLTTDEWNYRANSTELTLELDIQASGVSIFCHMEVDAGGPLVLDFTLARSALYASVSVALLWQPQRISLTSCATDVQTADMKVTGSSPLVSVWDSFGDYGAEVFGMFMSEPLCDGLHTLAETHGNGAFGYGDSCLEVIDFLDDEMPELAQLAGECFWVSAAAHARTGAWVVLVSLVVAFQFSV